MFSGHDRKDVRILKTQNLKGRYFLMTKRVLCTLLAASMAAAALVSCGNSSSGSSSKSESTGSTSKTESSASANNGGSAGGETESTGWTPNFDEEPYTLHFQYCVASEGAGQQGVADALDALAMEELNMHVDLIPLTMGAWAQTLSMTLAANEPLDLFLGSSGSFGTYIESQYVRDWTPYMDYIPDVIEGMGEDINAGYVGDFLVGFSQMKERGYWTGLIARKDIMDELGYKPEDFSITTQDMSTYEQLDELFAAVKAAYPEMIAVGGTSSLASAVGNYADNLGNNFGMLENYGQTTTITNFFETDLYRDLCSIQRRWFQAGYESADAATNQDSGETLMRAGNLFSFITNTKPNTDVEKLAQTGYEVYVIQTAEECFTSSMTVNAIVYCLANASEDPVKAAAFYNWCYQSQEFADLINWGVEGVDWVEKDGMAAYPDGVDANNSGYHNDFGWAYPNQFAGHPWIGNEPDIWDQYREYNASLLRSQAFGFTFDPTPVVDYVAACTSTYDQYDNDLNFGTIDTETGIKQLNDALYANGLQEIMDEKQRQLDEWLANKG